MSLVKTLAKVAAGVVVAKAVKGVVSGGGRPSSSRTSAGGGLDDILGQMLGGGGSGAARGAQGGGLQDMLGQVLGGGATAGGAQGGGLQDMLGQVLAGTGGAAAGRGGMGGMLDELSKLSRPGGATMAAAEAGTGAGSFGDLLNQSLERFGEPEVAPTRDQEELAGVLLSAMIQAAKADGKIDAAEKGRLLEQLGDVSQDEMAFVESELRREIDVDALARAVPRGAEAQVYMMSAMAIDLDETSEARYLAELSRGLGLDAQTVNAIHDRMGLPHIFR